MTGDADTSPPDPEPLYPQPEHEAGFLEILDGQGIARRRIRIRDRLEIGRLDQGQPPRETRLLVPDPSISRFHCVLRREDSGQWVVRDASRNGTRVDGRRLVPGVETVLYPGSVVAVGRDWKFRFQPAAEDVPEAIPATSISSETREVTVLVGDIRGYTRMVQAVEGSVLERGIAGIMGRLAERVVELGGTPKEFQGDAILAFWEEDEGANYSAEACVAALELDTYVDTLRAEWNVPGVSLAMDWALASGPVTLHGLGEEHRLGLTMIGEPVVRAYRLEKLADDSTGRILADEETRRRASDRFSFRSLGQRALPGFAGEQEVFVLLPTGTSS
jgi:class 3 adenylate cyclase